MDHAIPNRRNLLKIFGAGAGAAAFGALPRGLAASPARPGFPHRPDVSPVMSDLLCSAALRLNLTPTPSTTLGPYWLANMPIRSDIRGSQTAGLPVRLFYQVVDQFTQLPIANAEVDIWHANACGIYSGFASQGTVGETWLRGRQTTDANGFVVFETLFPGWYQGRTAHIHCRVRRTTTGTYDLTTQFFFDELLGFGFEIDPIVYQFLAPYGTCGAPRTSNAQDGIYNPALDQVAILSPEGGLALWAGIVIVI